MDIENLNPFIKAANTFQFMQKYNSVQVHDEFSVQFHGDPTLKK